MRRVALAVACTGSFAVVGLASGCGGDESLFNGEADAGMTPGPGSLIGGDGGDSLDCDVDCEDGFVCVRGKCLPPQDACGADGGACQFDTYCDPGTKTCVPFAPGGSNPACTQLSVPGNFAPRTKCEFPTAIPIVGDDFPDHVDVQTTPMVVRFGPAATTPPSIIVPFTRPVAGGYTEHLGVLRILRGTDCTQEAVLGGVDLDADGNVDWFRSSSSVAVGDLDGDGLPDIVAFMSSGPGVNETMMAFTRKSGGWQPLWATKKATLQDGVTVFNATLPSVNSSGRYNWASPSIHDLDDDGVPEIVREGWVFDASTGRLRATPPAGYASYRQGLHPVLANLDGDAKIEMTNGARVWEFDGASNAWVEETYYSQTQSSPAGWAAVADFDRLPGAPPVPEIAVTTTSGNVGVLMIFKTDHSLFMGMSLPVPGGGGGPPTIADFDGDGLPEIGVAGEAFYTVFDPDCQATPRVGGKCVDRTHCDHVNGGACPDKILWSRATQDVSSNVTGSSVFDFEADGKAEVVYADECFTRVYSGTDGAVLFSRHRSSYTWNENPIVADVDGDFRAELVVPSNTAGGPIGVGASCTAQTDPVTTIDRQFAGLRCLANSDCVSNVCDAGLCRCVTSADCCTDKDIAKCEGFGTRCAAPPTGTPGAGDTCRANRPWASQGIRVYEDAADRWVRSRTIWNQHAYAVTNINEDGTVPKTSAWTRNWTESTLNNFRQNVPGTQNAHEIGDLTSQASAAQRCDGSAAILATPVCNRGTAPIGSGVSVGFYVDGTKVCGTKTAGVLQVGQCETVQCTWTSPPSAGPGVDVSVVPNDDKALQQCDSDNDEGLVKGVFCKGVK